MDHESAFFEFDVIPSEKLPVLSRETDTDHGGSPEAELSLAIVAIGLRELRRGIPEARQWLQSDDFDFWASGAGLDADELRRRAAAMGASRKR